VRISAQLINAQADAHLWAETYDRDLRDVLELQSEVARAIAREIQVKVSPQEHTQLARTRPVNPEAYEAYLKGRYYWNRRTGESMKQGLACFERAIEIDPTYAAAHAGLADSAAVLGWWGFAPPDQGFLRAKEEARVALSIDATLPEPHACIGFSLLHYDYDLSAAEAAFRRALELNPRYATAVQWYSIMLSLAGRHEDCIAELQRATRLDPLSLVIQWTYAHFLFFSRRFDETICEARKALELDPNFAQARQVLGNAYEEKGMHDMALAELTEARRLSGCIPFFLGSLGYVYAGAGQESRALEIAKELQDVFRKPYPIAYWIAMIYANLGDKDEACHWLETGYGERSAHMMYLNVDPRFDKLRSDPRFHDLLRRLNFPA
jgi:tetratricopeptide (TPR) repeat protein